MVRLKKFKGTQLYLDMFATATRHRPLRILCSQKGERNAQPWWSNFPKQITAHVSVRVFRKPDGNRGFHDRYLITPEREILITHSLNGWHKDGVTFARLPTTSIGPKRNRFGQWTSVPRFQTFMSRRLPDGKQKYIQYLLT